MIVRPPLDRWMRLGARGVDVRFPCFLAPMVGLSHTALRQTVMAYLPRGATTVLFTEMLSSRRLPAERIGDRPETVRSPDEHSLAPQLLGNEERFMGPSLRKLAGLRPVAIDINMGCPVSKALRHHWGVALMGDPARAEAVVRTAVRLSTCPVSVKLRTGLADDPEYLVEFARMLEEAGAAWISLHPRIAAQQRRGPVRWEYIARVRDAVSIPVVGNGGVQTARDAIAMVRETGCDGVMIGRAAAARPWVFWQIGEALGWPPPPGREGEIAPADGWAEGREYGRALDAFIGAATVWFRPPDAVKRLGFFVRWGAQWLDFGHELWRRIGSAHDPGHARQIARDFFRSPQRMTERTSLAS